LCGGLSLLCDCIQSSPVMWFDWCLILFGWRYLPHVVGLALVFCIYFSWNSHRILSIALFVTVVTFDLLLKWALLLFTVGIVNSPIWAFDYVSWWLFWMCFKLLPSCVLWLYHVRLEPLVVRTRDKIMENMLVCLW
jgi:hypothetical protein